MVYSNYWQRFNNGHSFMDCWTMMSDGRVSSFHSNQWWWVIYHWMVNNRSMDHWSMNNRNYRRMYDSSTTMVYNLVALGYSSLRRDMVVYFMHRHNSICDWMKNRRATMTHNLIRFCDGSLRVSNGNDGSVDHGVVDESAAMVYDLTVLGVGWLRSQRHCVVDMRVLSQKVAWRSRCGCQNGADDDLWRNFSWSFLSYNILAYDRTHIVFIY